jgi:GTP cyclohydrolase II
MNGPEWEFLQFLQVAAQYRVIGYESNHAADTACAVMPRRAALQNQNLEVRCKSICLPGAVMQHRSRTNDQRRLRVFIVPFF